MKTLLALLVLMTSLYASAQTRIVSIDATDLSYTGTLMFKHDNGKHSDRDETRFNLNLNYAQNLNIAGREGLMWKAKAYFNRSDVDFGRNDTVESAIGAAGGVLYNFQANDIKNSVLLGTLLGVERATYEANGLDDKSGFNFFLFVEGGKRWDLGSYSMANISYAPTVSWTWKRYGGDIRDEYYKSGYDIRFNFLKFDVLF
jgi:hypothetical protein